MLDATSLYKQGITAIRNNDLQKGRKLLTRSLKIDGQNDKAWIWIARTYDDPAQRIKCLERALAINPNNPKAEQALHTLQMQNGHSSSKKHADPATINRLMQQAEKASAKNDDEGAIGYWVEVLDMQVDHPEAIKNAVKALIKLKYYDDAQELLWRAIDDNTEQVSIYHTAYDLAERNRTNERLDVLRRKVMTMPQAHETLFVRIAQGFIDTGQATHAITVLERGIGFYPNNQKLLLQMGDSQAQAGLSHQAVVYYNRAAKVSTSTPEGKEADKKLQDFPPVLTDKERGSTMLAWREVLGVFCLYLLLMWQDAGLNLLQAEPRHLIGLAISVIGGYLLITATSSPQQQIIAKYMGAESPNGGKRKGIITEQNGALQEVTELPILPQSTRFVLGGIGILILMIAFALVFGNSIELLLNPIDPPSPIFNF